MSNQKASLLVAAACLVAILAIGSAAHAECKASRLGIPDQAKFDTFFERFRAAVKAGDSNQIAAMATYPVSLHSKLGEFHFKSPSEFKMVVGLLLRDRVKDLIAKKTLKDLSCDSKDVRFQGGKVGVKWSNDRVNVTSITLD